MHQEPAPPAATQLSTSAGPAVSARQRGWRARLLTYGLVLAFVCALIGPGFTPARRAAAAPLVGGDSRTSQVLTFAATGHAVKTPAFVQYFQTYGGVATFGYPLAEEAWESGHLVQYFERQWFEYHPENAGSSFEVLLGRLGDEASRAQQPFATVAPFPNTATRVYVPETHHALAEPFLSYWRAHGGVRILGYPLSEVIRENGRPVQYFERARAEQHMENAGSPYEVLLSLLGRDSYQQHAALPAVNSMESRLLSEINGARSAAGLAPVALDPQLVALARDRAADMANRGYFSHTTPDGQDFLSMLQARGLPFVMAGEIIAKNNYPAAQTVDQAYAGYMSSPPHHAIIMLGTWRTAGVGAAVDGQGMYYYTVLFCQASK